MLGQQIDDVFHAGAVMIQQRTQFGFELDFFLLTGIVLQRIKCQELFG